MNKELSLNEVQEPISSAPPEVYEIIQRVLEVEKERIDRNEKGHINDDILMIVKEAVQ